MKGFVQWLPAWVRITAVLAVGGAAPLSATPANKKAAHAGGTIAGNARRELETKSGTKVSTKANFKELPEAKTRGLRKGKQPE
jgi:hypothetical protein